MTTTVLTGGRVVDPAARTETVADVVLAGGRVSAVVAPGTPTPDGARVVDVTGLVVGPGFVDLHSHVHSVAGQRLQAHDGVTTALDLESGLMPLERAYAEAAREGRPLHYGFSASWGGARAQVLAGVTPDATLETAMDVLGRERWQQSSSPAELAAWLDLLRGELAAGGLGIGVLLGYAPRSDPAEFLAVARLAAEAGAPVYTHVRELVEVDPSTPVDGSGELVRAAAETGAAMHHCHVNSTSRRHLDRVLGTLGAAQAEGSPLSLEAYPYGAGSTAVGAAFLDPAVLTTWGLTPASVVMLGSGERVRDERRLLELRRETPDASCILEFLDDRDPADAALLRRALEHPDAIVASDALPVYWPDGSRDTRAWPLPPGGATHPRTAGTFSRAIRLMRTGSPSWDWIEVFRRCSFLPARVIDGVAAVARGKGRLEAGSDADVVVLDPAAVTDRSTYADPTATSAGVRHLFVAGTPVIRDGRLDTDAHPGRPVRA